MTKTADSALWAEVISMAKAGTDATTAFRKVRTLGGRDLVKGEAEFEPLYAKLVKQPLFARNMLLSVRRSEFQQDVIAGTLSIDVDSDEQVDGVLETLDQFEKGSLRALVQCIDRIRVANPELAESLLATAKTLWITAFKNMETADAARAAAAESANKQLSLPLEPIEQPAVPDVRPEV